MDETGVTGNSGSKAQAATLREGAPEDAEAIAALHVAVWRATYRDYATPEAYETLDAARRLPGWQSALAAPEARVVLAEAQGALVGVICAAPAQHEAFGDRLEIKHLYVSAAARGAGVGRHLLQTILADSGLRLGRGVALAVVQQNSAARGFYRAMGGREIGRFIDPGPLWRSENVVVVWD